MLAFTKRFSGLDYLQGPQLTTDTEESHLFIVLWGNILGRKNGIYRNLI